MRKRRDRQGKRVYAWTYDWFDWNRATISREEAWALVKKACEAWDIHPPRSFGIKRHDDDCSVYEDGNQSLRMLPSHLNPATVLHEVAHHVIHVRYGTWGEDHGPDWLGVYVDLLVAFRVAPESAIAASLKQRKLKYNLPKGRIVLK